MQRRVTHVLNAHVLVRNVADRAAAIVRGFGLFGPRKGEGSQVHVPFRQNVNGENALAFWKTNLRDSRRNTPVVPLPPGKRVGSIECGGDGQRTPGLALRRSTLKPP